MSSFSNPFKLVLDIFSPVAEIVNIEFRKHETVDQPCISLNTIVFSESPRVSLIPHVNNWLTILLTGNRTQIILPCHKWFHRNAIKQIFLTLVRGQRDVNKTLPRNNTTMCYDQRPESALTCEDHALRYLSPNYRAVTGTARVWRRWYTWRSVNVLVVMRPNLQNWPSRTSVEQGPT
jgi:hypothetical protein